MRTLLVLSCLLGACSGGADGGAALDQEGFDALAPSLGRAIADIVFPPAGKPAFEEHEGACPDGGTIAVSGNAMRAGNAALLSGGAVATSCAAAGFVVSGEAAVTASQTPSETQVILFHAALTIEIDGEPHAVTMDQLIIQLMQSGACYHVHELSIDGGAKRDLAGGDRDCLGPGYDD